MVKYCDRFGPLNTIIIVHVHLMQMLVGDGPPSIVFDPLIPSIKSLIN